MNADKVIIIKWKDPRPESQFFVGKNAKSPAGHMVRELRNCKFFQNKSAARNFLDHGKVDYSNVQLVEVALIPITCRDAQIYF